MLEVAHNVYKSMPGLRINLLDQHDCNCCWAIAVGATVSSDYYRWTLLRKHQVSPQDILDRVWHYYRDEVKGKKWDTAGCFQCGLRKPFQIVRDVGVGFLESYPFKAKLDKKKGPVEKSEYPRIFIQSFNMKMTIEEVFQALTVEKRTVIGVVGVTLEFSDHKEGIYRHPIDVKADDFLGQHAVVIEGINMEKGYLEVMNSYGTSWGVAGRGKVAISVFIRFACPIMTHKVDQPRKYLNNLMLKFK